MPAGDARAVFVLGDVAAGPWRRHLTEPLPAAPDALAGAIVSCAYDAVLEDIDPGLADPFVLASETGLQVAADGLSLEEVGRLMHAA